MGEAIERGGILCLGDNSDSPLLTLLFKRKGYRVPTIESMWGGELYEGDIWDFAGSESFGVVVPVNCGLVHGRGLAKQMADRYPGLTLRMKLARDQIAGAVRWLPCCVSAEVIIVPFPVKTHWSHKANPTLVWRSAERLVRTMNDNPGLHVAMPLVGCGFGNLAPEEVVPGLWERLYGAGMKDRVVLVVPGTEVKERYNAALRPGVGGERKDTWMEAQKRD